MRVLLSTHGSRADVDVRGGRPRAAELVAAAAEEYEAPVVTGVMPTGVWR